MPKQLPPVRRNDDIELDITAMGAEGQGIGRVQGYAVFVPQALPGERVRAHIIKVGPGFGVGKLMEVLHPSSTRVEPPCHLNAKCGGCALQHMEYAAQLDIKRQWVEDALVRVGGFSDVQVPNVLGMEQPFYYRNKASFPFTEEDGKIEIGFFAPRSHRVVPVRDCLLQNEDVMLAALAVRDWANEYGLSAYDEQAHNGLLRHVVARSTSAGELMVTIVATSDLPHKKALIELLTARLNTLKSIYLNINSEQTNVIQGGRYQLLYGAEKIKEQLCGLTFLLGPSSFLQVNHEQTERLYRCALDMLPQAGVTRVVDAYCGIGTITLLLCERGREVIGIESVEEAIVDAKENAQRNGILNASFLCAPAEKALPELVSDGLQLDILVLDPPRKGADAVFLQAVLRAQPPAVLYISCNPATLARDCRILADGGYQISRVQPVDMFPQTIHVETVVLLQRRDT